MLINKREITYEYIRGLTDGEGCFTFHTANRLDKTGGVVFNRFPVFVINMNERDYELLSTIKEKLGLRNEIYRGKAWRGDGYNRGSVAKLMVRNLGELKNVIVPLFYKKLIGYKAKQFEEWIEKIGNDQTVMKSFKLIYRIYKAGYYDSDRRFS